MPEKYDAIIIGTGAGGGAIGWKLASSGKQVLFIERGKTFNDKEIGQDEKKMLIDLVAADSRSHSFDGLEHAPFTGGVTGGSTAVYGACLMRPGPSDFEPGRYYGDYIDSALDYWPVGLSEFEPWLTEAENLMLVAGDHNCPMPHLSKRLTPYPLEPMTMHAANGQLMETFKSKGLSPFPLPLGFSRFFQMYPEPPPIQVSASSPGPWFPHGSHDQPVVVQGL